MSSASAHGPRPGEPRSYRPGVPPGSGTVALVAAFAIVYVVWGSTYLAIAVAIESIPPLTMTAIRCLIAGAILFGWGRLRHRRPLGARRWRDAVVAGGLLFLGGQGALAWAEQHVASGVAALVLATIPLWMTLVQVVTDGAATIGARTMLGIAGGLAGLAVLVGPEEFLGGVAVDRLGFAVLALCAVSWAAGSARLRQMSRSLSLPLAMGSCLLAAAGLLAVAALLTGEAGVMRPAAVSLRSLLSLGYLIVFGTLITFSAYTWLVRHVSLAAVSTYAYVNPVIAVLLGWLLGGEPLTARVLAAATLIVLSVALVLTTRTHPAARSVDQVSHRDGARVAQ